MFFSKNIIYNLYFLSVSSTQLRTAKHRKEKCIFVCVSSFFPCHQPLTEPLLLYFIFSTMYQVFFCCYDFNFFFLYVPLIHVLQSSEVAASWPSLPFSPSLSESLARRSQSLCFLFYTFSFFPVFALFRLFLFQCV